MVYGNNAYIQYNNNVYIQYNNNVHIQLLAKTGEMDYLR